ncbi:hypothetical protein [Paenibacillus nasutitermitis]|uniref:Uncharacterized protein n=1 Tax=Paenibacillus nasutitermitis TaxID=1652958 RepID=A0A917DNL6_9BACL|nr:hypothetical protein [Paenibacillus nasutitermitis]GGD54040.1 hypothetical protein GCM10010911_09460 [Paenibacillus nasutitermitis]
MNRKTEELYRQLQEDPFRKRTFTAAKMDEILRLAREQEIASKRGKPSRKLWVISAASIAFVILVILFVQHPWRDKDVGDGGEITAKPPVTTPEPVKPDISVELSRETGELRDQLPFDTEKIESISLLPGSSGQEITVPADRVYVFPQNLYNENLSLAKADVQVSGDQDVLIRIHMADAVYAIPYDVDSNTYKLGNARFYADDQVMLLMHGLFRPESALALVDRIMAQASKEMNENDTNIDESFLYERERFDIAGKDYNAWADITANDDSYSYSIPYYDFVAEKMGSVREFTDKGLIVLQGNLVFLKDTVGTTDGIKVGMTKDQVMTILGKPNLKLNTRWSYKLGDYLKFHLYLENDQVVFMSLTMP